RAVPRAAEHGGPDRPLPGGKPLRGGAEASGANAPAGRRATRRAGFTGYGRSARGGPHLAGEGTCPFATRRRARTSAEGDGFLLGGVGRGGGIAGVARRRGRACVQEWPQRSQEGAAGRPRGYPGRQEGRFFRFYVQAQEKMVRKLATRSRT